MGGEIPWWIGKVLYHDEQLSCEPQDNFQFVHIIYNRDIPIMKTYEVLHPIISNDKFRLLNINLIIVILLILTFLIQFLMHLIL